MTVIKRGTMLLKCPICGYTDLIIVRHSNTKMNILLCEKCGFKFKYSGYFNLMPKDTLTPKQLGKSIAQIFEELPFLI
jgi:ribosomal protein L37AE/L43A